MIAKYNIGYEKLFWNKAYRNRSVYKFKRIDGNTNISDQTKKKLKRYKIGEIQH